MTHMLAAALTPILSAMEHGAASILGLPGGDLVLRGISDLEHGVASAEALLVSIGAPRLCRLGFRLAEHFPAAEHRLYELLAADDSDAAHSRYNALVRRLVSFERAAGCAS
jgi:hypothetical protein